MRRAIRTEIEIETPVEVVWSALSDWPRYPEWNPWMTRIEGALRVGAKLDVRLAFGRRQVPIAPTLVHVDEGRAFRWLGHLLVPGLFDGEHAFELLAVSDATTRFVHSERFSGVLSGPVLRAVGEATERGFRRMNEALKKRCETAAASDPSSA